MVPQRSDIDDAQAGRRSGLDRVAMRLGVGAIGVVCLAAGGCVSLQLGPVTPPLAASWLADRGALETGLTDPGRSTPSPRQAGRRVAKVSTSERPVGPIGTWPPPRASRPVPERAPAPAHKPASGSASSTSPQAASAPAPAPGPTQAPRQEAKAQPAANPPAAAGTAAPDARAAERVAAAQRLLDRVGNADQPLVDEILHAAGQGIAISSRVVYAAGLLAHLREEGKEVARGAVAPGDVAFFRDTLDLNGNRRPDDGVTFAALVERVEAGRVVVIARRGGRVRRLALDPSRPTAVHDEHGQVVNTRLVQWPGQPAPWTTGQCLAAYARP